VSYASILENNRLWAQRKIDADPRYFEALARGQHPEYLYIGCSDSRVPANEIMDLHPGEVFVHRNVANIVSNTDLNVAACIEYAVVTLGVRNILVCGHYGCGGVQAALEHKDLGILNPWLRNVRDIYRLYQAELDAIGFEEQRYNRLVELNVAEQCMNVIKTACVQKSYLSRGYPTVHGMVFDLKTGLIKDLKLDFKAMLESVQKIYRLTETTWF
jgi:carbonic anhydrase